MKRALLVGAVLVGAMAPSTFAATVVNGDFEAGLAGWSGVGNFGAGDFGSGALQDSMSGIMNTTDGASDADVEAFFGFAAGAIDAFCAGNVPGCSDATEGSALKQTIFASAGETVSFIYKFFTDETVFDGDPLSFNDFGAVVFNGVILLADAGDTSSASTSIFDTETGLLTFTTTVTSTGLQDLGFMVFDVMDTGFDSGLMVDVVIAPEPTSLTLLALGLGGVGVARRFKLIR